jgi:hypothetical protein
VARRRSARRVAAAPEETQAHGAHTGIDINKLVEAVRVMASGLAGIAIRVGPLREKDDRERIHSLILQGFTRAETAGILGTTPETVRVRMHDIARTGRRRKRSGKR